MRYFLFFLSLVSSFSLFSDDDWDGEAEEGYYFSPGISIINYGGINFRCDFGCGNPDCDPDAEVIQYLYCNCLSKPLFNRSLSVLDQEIDEQLDLPQLNFLGLFESNLKTYFSE